MDLQAIRTYVRTHMDLDSEDLPDSLLDLFAREASKKVERAEKRWPFYAVTYALTTTADTADYALSSISTGDLREVVAITSTTLPLQWLGPDQASDAYLRYTGTGEPVKWSQWGSTVTLYPTPDASYTLTARGYRTPTDWVAAGAGGEPDMDDDLHMTVATWVLSRAYAQQEDTELAAYFAQVFDAELEAFRRRIVDSPPPQPLILGRNRRRTTLSRPPFDWE